jgi:hypothetical protein
MTVKEQQPEGYNLGAVAGRAYERDRIIQLLTDLNAIRRDALGHLVAFNTDGTQVIYLTGLESEGGNK